MNFICEVTNSPDGVGVEWCEPRWFIEACVKGVGTFGFSISIICGSLSVVTLLLAHPPAWLIFAAMAAAVYDLSFGIIWLGVRVPAKQRAIYFKRNGAIESPFGLYGGIRVVGAWQTKVGDIANIEMEQIAFPKPDQVDPYTHGVRMIMRSGRVFHIAGNLMPDQAHELAVSLSQAREAMRYDVSPTSPRARSREAVY